MDCYSLWTNEWMKERVKEWMDEDEGNDDDDDDT